MICMASIFGLTIFFGLIDGSDFVGKTPEK
jgi:hypothetical protein